MNWIERYVEEVKRYMPQKGAEDVGDELNSLLQEQCADREEELSRPLDEEETFTVLKEFGHPLKVASAYSRSGPLISEALFPIYWLAVKYMAFIILTIYAVSVVSFYLSGQRVPWTIISLGDVINLILLYFAITTLIFHLADHFLVSKDFFSNWKPSSLPSLGLQRESMFSSVIVVVILLGWFRLLSLIPMDNSLEVLLGDSNNRITTFVLWLKIQALLSLPVYIWLLFKPFWSITRRLVTIVADLAVIVGGIIALSISPELFTEVFAGAERDWEFDLVGLSSYILVCWALILCGDVSYQFYKIWRGNSIKGDTHNLTT